MSTRIARNAVTTLTVLTAVLWANPGRADHDRSGWREGPRAGWAVPRPIAPIVVVPAPVRPMVPRYAPAPPVVIAPWRVAHWRAERRIDELRHDYRELAVARERFYASWDGRPWTRDRFEGWYAARRADLDARSAELSHWRR